MLPYSSFSEPMKKGPQGVGKERVGQGSSPAPPRPLACVLGSQALPLPS